MRGGQNCLLLAMEMAKVCGPLSIVKVCISMLCKNRVSVSAWPPTSAVKVFTQIWTSQVFNYFSCEGFPYYFNYIEVRFHIPAPAQRYVSPSKKNVLP